ncbi:hypothetical protein BLNAU_13958 [Blattamonas nauphoetae]|uniref:Uncharacterized protein n=1 Tax=Blattamonas nauphoetae TaxID=2049346 RepID=A0ABQ9XLU5_9EUKA|nr:hypothetical protein BLNAU_13958 [Blattamonas nauphoetae]
MDVDVSSTYARDAPTPQDIAKDVVFVLFWTPEAITTPIELLFPLNINETIRTAKEDFLKWLKCQYPEQPADTIQWLDISVIHLFTGEEQLLAEVDESEREETQSMIHVVTGSPGIGKSALRFPAITLALSLGAEAVCTAKAGEYPLIFVRTKSEKTRQKTGISQPNLSPTPDSIPATATSQGDEKRKTTLEENGSAQKVKTEKHDPNDNSFDTPPTSPLFSPSLNLHAALAKRTHSLDSEASHHLSADTSTPPAKQLTVHVTHANKPPRDIAVTPTIYKYEVFAYNALVQASSGHEEQYGKDLFPKEKKIKLGEVEMPSIHHFPHFLRLFLNRRNKIKNRLEGKTWHFVDDLVLVPGQLNPSQHYVLLTSPNQNRWADIVKDDEKLLPFVLYVSPRYTLFEGINMLNAIPSQIKSSDQNTLAKLEKLETVVEMLGFTPRNIQDYMTQDEVLDRLAEQALNPNVSGDVFGDEISHKLIVLDSPQADPHNFTMAYASPKAKELLAQKWMIFMQSKYNAFMEVPDTPVSDTDLVDPMLFMLFQRLTHSSIRLGAQFSKIKDLDDIVTEADENMSLSYPPAPTRSAVDSSGTCNTHHAFLPDMAEFRCLEHNKFDDDKWGRFFLKCMIGEPSESGPVELTEGKYVFKKKEPTTPLEEERVDSDESASSSEEPTASEPEQPISQEQTYKSGRPKRSNQVVRYFDKPKKRKKKAKVPAQPKPHKQEPFEFPPSKLHYYTFHLVPLGQCNAGFDSILLFFRVIPNAHPGQPPDQPPQIHSLGVHFLQSTIRKKHTISKVGANLMKAWLVLLMDVYGLSMNQIFPHFVFVVSDKVFKSFRPETVENITSFIPAANIVIAALTSPTKNLIEIKIEAEDELLLDTGERLPPNNDAMCVRCGFCGEVIGDRFYNHICAESIDGSSNLNFRKTVFDTTNTNILFVRKPEGSKKMDKAEKALVAEDDPTFFYKRKTLAERLSNGQLPCSDPDSDTNLMGLQLKYPCPDATIPNTKQSGNYFTPLLMNVTMVPPLDAFSEQDEKLKQETPLISSTVENPLISLAMETPPPSPVVETPPTSLDMETLLTSPGVVMQPTDASIEAEMTVEDIRKTLLNDSFGDGETEKLISMTITVSSHQPLPPPCHLYRTPFYEPPRRTYPILPELRKIETFAKDGPMNKEETAIAKLFRDDPSRNNQKNDEKSDEREDSLSANDENVYSEPDYAAEPPRARRLSHADTSTSHMAKMIKTWMDGLMIVLVKRGNTYFGATGTYKPHADLEYEEPTPYLIKSNECLGQMMLPFEHVGELRERIRRSFPAIHPYLFRPRTPLR